MFLSLRIDDLEKNDGLHEEGAIRKACCRVFPPFILTQTVKNIQHCDATEFQQGRCLIILQKDLTIVELRTSNFHAWSITFF